MLLSLLSCSKHKWLPDVCSSNVDTSTQDFWEFQFVISRLPTEPHQKRYLLIKKKNQPYIIGVVQVELRPKQKGNKIKKNRFYICGLYKWLYFRPKKTTTSSNDRMTTKPVGRLQLNFSVIKKKKKINFQRTVITEWLSQRLLYRTLRIAQIKSEAGNAKQLFLHNTVRYPTAQWDETGSIPEGEEINEGIFDVQTNR